MSSFDRCRDFRRKKYTSNRPDREDKQFKRPVILLKGKESDQNKTDGPIQPTIILKSREADSRAISPNLQAGKPKKDGDPSPSYHLAPKTIQPESVNLTWMPPMMKKSVKLLDNSTLQMCDGLLEFLTDQTDFLVVGCLGLQGVGKSTVMSHLAAPPEILFDESTFKYKKIKMVFPSHSTEGVDAFITPDRVILLDCQPLLAMSKVPRNPSDNSRNTNREDADFSVPENDNEIESLQYAAFIFSVCHVVLIVQDWGGNPDYMRFYHTAEMLKPATPTPTEDEELVEYFPHAMIIHTKTKPPYFSREKFHELQEHYRDAFALSNLQLHTGLSIANGNVVKTLNAKLCNGEPLNLYLLPPFQNGKSHKNVYKGHLGYNDLFCKMRQLIFGVAPIPLSHTILTEKNWWHYAVKIWDGIRKSSYFPEYHRLMPTSTSFKAE